MTQTPATYSGPRHSLRLSDWGPYTKRYVGISHIPDERAGLRFDLSVFPGLYRRKVDVPNVMWESGYHPWEAAADLSYFSFRHELEWKDQVYCDISYSRIDEASRLVRCECVNRTDRPQTLALHYLASMNFPPPGPYSAETLQAYRPGLPQGAAWVRAMDYCELRYAQPRPTDTLMPDGLFRGESCGHGFTGPSGLGWDFGKNRGDTVSYRVTIQTPLPAASIVVRYRMEAEGQTVLLISGTVQGRITLAGNRDFRTAACPLGQLPAGEHLITFTAEGGAAVCLDGLAIVPSNQVAQVAFEPVVYQPRPERLDGPHANSLLLKYPDVDCYYGLAWAYEDFTVREIHDSNLDRMMRHFVHDHVRSYLPGDQKAHYTNVFFRPIALPPHGSLTLDGLVCQGTREEVQTCLQRSSQHLQDADRIYLAAKVNVADPVPTPAGRQYQLSQRLMAATTLSNLVYPVYTQRSYIKHYTPGRWWDCLYTWDSGFLGLGLAEHDTDRAIDCLKGYVTDVGNPHAAFIHHGSTVPTQLYLFLELWNRTQSRQLLEYFYPRLRQYYLFMAGRLGSSTLANLKSGLLRPWDYFYNSGGWDDYPPQVQVHAQHLTASVAPACTTAHAARCARILRMAALALQLREDVADYEADIRRFGDALQRHAWDEEAGYFSYVTHDAAGQASGILRHASGANFNMGLDGVIPLFAGLCTPAQERRLLEHLGTEGRLWTRIGLSAVDLSAPYYRPDGYWNGAVWMPHQWFAWKTMLDLGQADLAFRIARCGLNVWQQETDDSYHCFEHFIIETGRGAGWHQFTGLSSPVMSWFAAYYRPGRFTCGLDAWIERQRFAADDRSLEATLALHGAERHTPCAVICMNPDGQYRCTWNGLPLPARELLPGCLSVAFPTGDARGVLKVEATP